MEFTTGLRDYSVPFHEPQGDFGERPDWVGEKNMKSIRFVLFPWDVFKLWHSNLKYILILGLNIQK